MDYISLRLSLLDAEVDTKVALQTVLHTIPCVVPDDRGILEILGTSFHILSQKVQAHVQILCSKRANPVLDADLPKEILPAHIFHTVDINDGPPSCVCRQPRGMFILFNAMPSTREERLWRRLCVLPRGIFSPYGGV